MTNVKVTASGTLEARSTWQRPTFAIPDFVPDGVLRPEHFKGAGYVQVWGKSQPYCDHVFSANGARMSGSYLSPIVSSGDSKTWSANFGQPIVVRAVTQVPTVTDKGKSIVWPAPGFSMRGLKGIVVDLIAFGSFPAELLEMIDCEFCKARVHLHGTCGDFWKMKGLATIEGGTGNCVEVLCGHSYSSTGVRCLATTNPTAIVHSGVVCEVQHHDTGGIVANPRYRKPDGTTGWAECGGTFEFYGKMLKGPEHDALCQLKPSFRSAEIMLDDWWYGAHAFAPGGEVYLCGQNNTVFTGVGLLDDRADWTERKGVPNGRGNAKGNTFYEGCRTI